ncbi:hypothetical protein SZMC14600_04967 [Saccharomonospora azurea SZMC 14600]|nr:hypothetical protein SZMC14600_04967 [Saccharomonospora azurea SZMC 14600]
MSGTVSHRCRGEGGGMGMVSDHIEDSKRARNRLRENDVGLTTGMLALTLASCLVAEVPEEDRRMVVESVESVEFTEVWRCRARSR